MGIAPERRRVSRQDKSWKFPKKRFSLAILPFGDSGLGVRKQAIISLIVGATLGCVAGAVIQNRGTPAAAEKPYLLSVNQRTGKPQLHVQGKPEPE